MKRILLVIVGVVALLALVVAAAPVFLDRYRPQWERAATDALGMDVRVGRLGIGLLPGGPHLTAGDGRILGERGVAVASAKRVGLWIDMVPLLGGQFRLRRIVITEARVLVERDAQGRLNVEPLRKALPLLAALDGGRLSLSDGAVVYVDRRKGQRVEATHCDLVVSRIQLAGGTQPRSLRDLWVQAQLACGTIRTRDLVISDLAASVEAKDGVFEVKPITLHLFGGQMSGSIHADASGPVLLCRVRCFLPQFRIEEFLRTLSPKKAVEGAMDFTMSLSMQGETMDRMVRSAAGDISLRGANLVLEGTAIDQDLSRFASSQNFNLVDVGAVFFAGPLGLTVTKGYGFASLFQGTGGRSMIRTLVSTWKVDHGVARANDVAMATTKNRIALQGALDFVHGRFADVTVAVIDAKGCPLIRQAIRGDFAKPVVEKPRILASFAGPWLRLYSRARGLFPDRPCEVFYSGSVAPPTS